MSVPVKSWIGEMSSTVSRSPSARNWSKLARWMAIRLGTSGMRGASSLVPLVPAIGKNSLSRVRRAVGVLKSQSLLT